MWRKRVEVSRKCGIIVIFAFHFSVLVQLIRHSARGDLAISQKLP